MNANRFFWVVVLIAALGLAQGQTIKANYEKFEKDLREMGGPKDPCRLFDGKKEWAVDLVKVKKKQVALQKGWVTFWGQVVEVQPNGIRVLGLYTGRYDETTFFVANFPYKIADGSHIGLGDYVAKEDGVYSYETVLGGKATLTKFDYGKIYDPPLVDPPAN